MSNRDLQAMGPAALLAYREECAEELARAKIDLNVADAAIAGRFQANVLEAFARAEKDHGTARAALEDGVVAIGSRAKKVEWNQAVLNGLAGSMSAEEFRHYFKAELSVPESIYKAAPPAIKARFDAARTVKLGDLKVSLEKTA